jgi:hypothetical protein
MIDFHSNARLSPGNLGQRKSRYHCNGRGNCELDKKICEFEKKKVRSYPVFQKFSKSSAFVSKSIYGWSLLLTAREMKHP